MKKLLVQFQQIIFILKNRIKVNFIQILKSFILFTAVYAQPKMENFRVWQAPRHRRGGRPASSQMSTVGPTIVKCTHGGVARDAPTHDAKGDRSIRLGLFGI